MFEATCPSRTTFTIGIWSFPYKGLRCFSLRYEAPQSRCRTLVPLWTNVEVPQGCMDALSLCSRTWGGERTSDAYPSWWVVAWTEIVVKAASFGLQEA